ncbi:hypothetical protein [Cellulophaga tyrosinoxydans]|uniref:Uncharacterized protein n=1 Tax=Cellulophaga tyrosinoxydans TaxID=504486 RepID=A0A1W1YHQ8_9FLAO|nr:hypothetical protein [Cellulophaga tyrosinoxydans]SMC35268.1 hypothetical protein SAMN05660703_0451 [Cellulophaga tyrosinoxydans]
MKKVFIAVLAIVLNTFLFSCTKDTSTQSDLIYETNATEGDDGDIKPPPPPPDPV